MDSRQIRFAFIGASNIARKHALGLQRIEGATLVAVCDLDEGRRSTMTGEFGGTGYEDYREMLAQEDIDVVSVMTPSGTHADITCDVAKTGRHVVVEKPLALLPDDVDRQLETCAAHDVRLFTVMQNRFSRPVSLVRSWWDKGKFGKPVMGTVRVRWSRDQGYYDAADWRGTWARDGGVFCNQACHHIDLLCWFFGPVESVMAQKATRLADIEAEDTGLAILRFESGALGLIEATTAWRPNDLEGSLSIAAENGSAEIGGFVVNEMRHAAFSDGADLEPELSEFGTNPNIPAWTHEQFLRDVVSSLQDGSPALIEGAEGRSTVEVINAIYESAETGREVFFRFQPKFSKLGREK